MKPKPPNGSIAEPQPPSNGATTSTLRGSWRTRFGALARNPKAQTITIIAVLVCAGLACYGFALRLPLFWDDIFQFSWLDSVSLGQIWTMPVTGLNYFRPLAFSLWKILRLLQGHWDGGGQHLMTLALHLVNACLLAGIVTHLAPSRKMATGLATGLLFLLFPFSFQAVVPVNSLMHPLSACLILAATLAYLLSDGRPRAPLRIISILLAGLAIFAHENGALAAAMVTLTAVCAQPRKPPKRLVADLWPYWIAMFVSLALWRSAPRAGNPLPLDAIFTQLESRLQNSTYFLQAFAFPISFLAREVKSAASTPSDSIALLAVCIPGIAAWCAVALRARRVTYALWAIGWAALAALPSIAMLSFNYVLESPRLVYLASVGAAIFWAIPSAPSGGSRTADRINRALATLVVLASAAWGAVYIQKRADLYDRLGSAIYQLRDASERSEPCAQGVRRDTLLINYPAWFYVNQPEYLVGHDGITTLSADQKLDDLYRINFGKARRFTTAVLPDILPRDADFTGLGDVQTQDSLQTPIRAAGQVIVNTLGADGMVLRYAGCLSAENQSAPAAYQAIIGDRLLLLHSEYRTDPARGDLQVTLDWHVQAPDPEDVTVFAQLIDATGRLIAQADGYPLAGASPSRLWRLGDQWRDVRTIHVEGGLPREGSYRVLAGAYVTAGAARLHAYDPAGRRLPDDAVVVAAGKQ
ncbi:MAG: hypothetical protein M1140_04780 [Chloroflexi bacterium]|nr:hypothetical protein [Chloroflexota bacterium]